MGTSLFEAELFSSSESNPRPFYSRSCLSVGLHRVDVDRAWILLYYSTIKKKKKIENCAIIQESFEKQRKYNSSYQAEQIFSFILFSFGTMLDIVVL